MGIQERVKCDRFGLTIALITLPARHLGERAFGHVWAGNGIPITRKGPCPLIDSGLTEQTQTESRYSTLWSHRLTRKEELT